MRLAPCYRLSGPFPSKARVPCPAQSDVAHLYCGPSLPLSARQNSVRGTSLAPRVTRIAQIAPLARTVPGASTGAHGASRTDSALLHHHHLPHNHSNPRVSTLFLVPPCAASSYPRAPLADRPIFYLATAAPYRPLSPRPRSRLSPSKRGASSGCCPAALPQPPPSASCPGVVTHCVFLPKHNKHRCLLARQS